MNTNLSPAPVPSDPRDTATAWALDELTPEERAAFEQQSAEDAELAALAEETRDFCGLLTGTLRQPSEELRDAARRRVLFEAGRPRRDAKATRGKWFRRMTTMAACIAAGSGGTYWWLVTNGYRAERRAAYAEAPRHEDFLVGGNGGSGLEDRKPEPLRSPNAGIYSSTAPASQPAGTVAIASPASASTDPGQKSNNTLKYTSGTTTEEVKRHFNNGLALQQQGHLLEAEDEYNRILALDPTNSDAQKHLEVLDQRIPRPQGYLKSARNPAPLRMAVEEDAAQTTPAPTAASAPASPADAAKMASGTMNGTPGTGAGLASTSVPGRGIGRGPGFGSGYGPGVSPPASSSPVPGQEMSTRNTASYKMVPGTGPAKAKEARPKPAVVAASEPSGRLSSDNFEVQSDAILSGESYAQTVENSFLTVLGDPLSTFSIDVDTASYSNVRRFLNMGQAPPPAAVRLEELVNYFPYEYAQPTDGKPFAVHVEMTSAPWNASHRVARIALKGKEIAQGERPAANLVFLVDVSGSMDSPLKLPLVKQSLKFVVERLTDKDTVSLVTYAGESGVALPATNGGEKARIMAAIDGLGAGGSTNGAGGINTAYAQAAKHFQKEGINRVILATDGDFNVGASSDAAMMKLITEKAKSGVFLSVLGYGMGNTKDSKMEILADKGNGNYAYIESLSEARKSLADQLNGTLVTIAKDVKIQIEFNPAVIRSYRLLGYENRMLAKEDFNNDKKDAGEIGAGHTVTALYELIPAGVAEERVSTDTLKYQTRTAQEPPQPAVAPPADNAGNGETMTVKLRWKAPDADVSQLMEVPVKDGGGKIAEASGETRWAVAVAGFAALLNNSQYPGLSWEDVRALARGSKGADPNGYRGEFLQLLDKAESLGR